MQPQVSVCAEHFIDTVDICQAKIANIQHFRVTLREIEHLCQFGELKAFYAVQEVRHREDRMTMVYSPLPVWMQNTVCAHTP